MVNGLVGETTLLVLRAAEVDVKQEQENVLIHLHLEEESRVPGIPRNQGTVTRTHVQVYFLHFSFSILPNIHYKFIYDMKLEFNELFFLLRY